MNERMKLRSLQTFNQFKLDLETTKLTSKVQLCLTTSQNMLLKLDLESKYTLVVIGQLEMGSITEPPPLFG